MARPEKNTVDYYPHLVGDGKKMFFIETRYGNDGYATWHKLLEKLCATEYHYLDLNLEEEVMFLSAKCRVSIEMLINIINDITKLGEFDKELWNQKIIWCQPLVDSIEDAYKKRNNECITRDGLSNLLSGLSIPKPDKLPQNEPRNTQRKEEESKVNKSKVEGEQSRAFAPPSQNDVFIFFKEKAIESGWADADCKNEAEKFINFYDSKNWYVGKNKMVKWPSAASGWIKRAFDFKMEPKNKKDNEFPDYYDRKFEAKLNTQTCQKYHQHLKKNNWEPVFANEGYIANWRKTM